MILIDKPVIEKAIRKHADARGALQAWCHEMDKGTWNSPDELKERFPRVSFLRNDRVVFKIKGNRYRLVVKINYQKGYVFVRFCDSHEKYDAINAEEV